MLVKFAVTRSFAVVEFRVMSYIVTIILMIMTKFTLVFSK